MKKILFNILIMSILCLRINAQENVEILNDESVIIINEATVNGEKLDFSPTFYEDGVVFISSYTDKKNKVFDGQIASQAMMIKIARRGADGKLMPPQAFAQELITPYHEGPLTFDKLTEEVFFSRNNYEHGKIIVAKEKETGKERALQQIYTATKKGNKWDDVKKLAFNINEYAFRHPSLSIDGKKLYFSSNRPGGKGGYDIWVSTRVAGEWSEPVNAGDEINSKGNEGFPFIHADGTLFFASDGRGGLGALDMYFAKANGKKGFMESINLGQPFNSMADDFGLILDLNRKNGYFTSSRTGGKGMDDIYSFHSDQKVPLLPDEVKQRKATLCVADKVSSESIEGATIRYVNIDNYNINEMTTDNRGSISKLTTTENVNILELVQDQPAMTLTSGADCKAPFVVEEGEYLVNVTKEGYAPKQVILKTKKDKDAYQVLLEKLDGKVELVGLISDNNGKPLPGAIVIIKDDETGEEQEVTTDPNGQIQYAVAPKRCYTLTTKKQNYGTQTSKVCSEELVKDKITKVPVKVNMVQTASPYAAGKVIELTNVYYNFNDATLRPDALRDINALLNVMQEYPEIEIELASHTDSRASDAYNNNLSQRRAESVVNYLMEHGVNRNRLIAKGYGESRLRNQCSDGAQCTEEEHQRNRRTEVKILRGANNASISVLDNLPEVIDPKPGMGGSANPSSGSKISSGVGEQNSVISAPTDIDMSGVGGDFWVIVGSYSNAQNATEHQLRMLNVGYSETTIEYAQDINMNRVVVGKMNSMEAATMRIKELRAQGEKSIFIMKK